MPENQSVQQHNNSSDETTVVEECDSATSPITFNQQNNFHLTQQLDPMALKELSAQDSELAKEYIAFYKSQQEHNKAMDIEVLSIEKTEQKARIDEMPHQRKYAFLSLFFSIGISLTSLGVAAYFAKLGYPWLAGIAISVPIGVLAVNLINKKAKTKLPDMKQSEKTEED
jgi:hypothetical protein